MKMNFKTLSVMALAGLMVLGSCKKNEENTNSKGSVLFAGIEQPTSNTRTSLDPSTGVINWSAGDKIMVNNGSVTAEFSLTAGAGETTATFNGPGGYEDATTYVAAYPAANVTGISGTTVSFNIPSEQTLTTGNTFGNGANPMVACGDEENLMFKSVFGGLHVKLLGMASSLHVTKMVLTSNSDEMLCGEFTVNASATTPTASTITNGSNAITLNLPAGGVTLATDEVFDAFIMLPAGTLSTGFSIKVYDGDLAFKEASTSTSMTIAGNAISDYVTFKVEYPIGTITNPSQIDDLMDALSAPGSEITTVYIVDEGTGGEPTVYDFHNETIDVPVVVSEGSNVVINNLNANVTNSKKSASDEPAVIVSGGNVTFNNLNSFTEVTGIPAVQVNDGAEVTFVGGELLSKVNAPAIVITESTVVFDNVDLTSTTSVSGSRPINIEDGANVTITGSRITGAGLNRAESRALNVYGHNVNITVTDSKIKNARYAVNFPSSAANVNLTLTNDTIEGWGAINIWGGPNHYIEVNNCYLKGVNNYSGSTNSFATVVINKDCSNNTIQLNNCDVYAKANGTAAQTAAFIPGTGNNKIAMYGGSITGETTNTDYCVWITTSGSEYELDIDDNIDIIWNEDEGKGTINGKPAQIPFALNGHEGSK